MSSWRDSASAQAQDDLDMLVGEALPFAQETLSKHGEFFPYGVSLNADGEVAMAAADSGEGEHPASDDVRGALVSGFTQSRDSLRAIAVVFDVRLAESDAIRVELEHSEGHALAVHLPYAKKWLRGMEFGDLRAVPSERQVWT